MEKPATSVPAEPQHKTVQQQQQQQQIYVPSRGRPRSTLPQQSTDDLLRAPPPPDTSAIDHASVHCETPRHGTV
ncbi:hypothetical protein BST61_g2671 [Cercospora zeina]